MTGIDNEDKKLLVQIYKLNSDEIVQAEKMFHRSGGMSILACGKAVAQKRKTVEWTID